MHEARNHIRRLSASRTAALVLLVAALLTAQSTSAHPGHGSHRTADAPSARRMVRIGVQAAPVETQHYRVYSELDRNLTTEFAAELEASYQDYARRLGTFADTTKLQAGRGEKYEVHLFRTQASYAQFTQGDLPNSAGAFYPSLRSLCAYLEGQGTAEMKQTLRHEAFHQFAYEVIGPGLPQWLNEGLAQVFEHGVRIGDELEMGQLPPGPLREIQTIVAGGETIDFTEMLSMTNGRWNAGMADRRRGSVQYAQAWAMVHFLIYATDDAGNPKYRGRFNAMLRDLANGASGTDAFRRHFGNNLMGFRRQFERWALAAEPTRTAAALDDQTVLADMLMLLHKQGVGFTDAQHFGKYVIERGFVLTRSRNGVQWSSDRDPRNYFVDEAGRPLSRRDLRFDHDPLGPLPVLHRRPGDGRVYETRFYDLGGEVWSETTCRRE